MREIRSQKETVDALAHLIRQVKQTYSNEQPLVVGIHTGGAWIASLICNQLHWDEPATLDISSIGMISRLVALNALASPIVCQNN